MKADICDKELHVDSPWNRGVGNSEMVYYIIQAQFGKRYEVSC